MIAINQEIHCHIFCDVLCTSSCVCSHGHVLLVYPPNTEYMTYQKKLLPCVITSYVHFHSKEEGFVHDETNVINQQSHHHELTYSQLTNLPLWAQLSTAVNYSMCNCHSIVHTVECQYIHIRPMSHMHMYIMGYHPYRLDGKPHKLITSWIPKLGNITRRNSALRPHVHAFLYPFFVVHHLLRLLH